MRVKIITCCKQGLNRSVGLADVLKMHFEPVDVIPVGLWSNSTETLTMLADWADKVIIMEQKYIDKYLTEKIPEIDMRKVLCCDVGPDVYGNAKHPALIDYCWRWVRTNIDVLNIEEHFRRL